MSIVFACIAPHSGNLLISPDQPSPIPKARDAMQELHGRWMAAKPDSVAIITPHGQSVAGYYTLGRTARCSGELDGTKWSGPTDIPLVDSWANFAAARNVPVVRLVGERDDTEFPLDWGALIPLALLVGTENDSLPVAVACPSTDLSHLQLVAWGEALVDAAAATNRRVALIVSADQGHGHANDGPYGFNQASAEYDAAMTEAVRANDLKRLLAWDDRWLEAAKVDSYWQTLCLLGIQRHVSLLPEVLSYEVDHYFGLLVASFTPK